PQAPASGAAVETADEAAAAQDEQALADDVDRNVAAFIDRGIDQARDARADAAIVPAAPVAAVAGGFEATGDEIDDEIREVFLEEFGEEIDNLDQMLPVWREKPEDMERLRPIRRVFHTLKGSGRLVGARALGEFSWKVENMLNRVL